MGHDWLAAGSICASSLNDAYKRFTSKLNDQIARIAFVSQCYADFLSQSFLVVRDDIGVGFFRYTEPATAVGLMFMEEKHKALEMLSQNKTIPDEFFYYWHDAVNTVGYSAKLLLMFSALEALVKNKPGQDRNYRIRGEILGTRLKQQLYGVKGASKPGLRNRLVHGEYFAIPDSDTNCFEQVHKKIISYFNDKVFRKNLLETDVVNPQRHVFGNRQGYRLYVRPIRGGPLDLKSLLREFKEFRTDHGLCLENYELVDDADLQKYF